MAEYLMHFEDNSHITFELYDTPVVDAWRKVLTERIELGHNTPIGQHGYWQDFDDKLEFVNTIEAAIAVLNDSKLVDLEFNKDNITRKKLNELHDRFHEFEEPLLLGTQSYSVEVTQALHDLNESIHGLERMFDGATNEKTSYWVSQVDTDLDRRIPITPEWREEYWKYTNTKKACILRLGYATIGKNMMHLVYDRNPELWPDNVRPQNNIHTETIVEYNAQPYTHADEQNKHWLEDLQKFCKFNSIEYKDLDVQHTHCIQPVLGELVEDLTQQQVAEKFRITKCNRVELV